MMWKLVAVICLVCLVTFGAADIEAPQNTTTAKPPTNTTANPKTTNSTTAKSTTPTSKSTNTTTAKSTTPTAKPTNSTTAKSTTPTAKPTNSTTAKPTTQPPKPVTPTPTNFKFDFKENGKICLKWDGGLFIQVVYQTNGSYKMANLDVGKGVKSSLNGSRCGVNETIPALLIYQFETENNSSVTLTGHYVEINGVVYAKDHSVVGTVTKEDLPGANDTVNLNETQDLHYKLCKSDTYFNCDQDLTIPVSKTVSLFYGVEKFQAFDVNGNFSENSTDCQVPDSPSAAHPVETHSVKDDKNQRCIIIKGGMTFTVPYTTSNSSASKTYGLPNTTVVDYASSCKYQNDSNKQYLRLDFYNSWSVMFTFTRNSKDFKVDQVDLTYYINEDSFPDFKLGTGGLMTVSKPSADMFKGTVDGSYKCDKGDTIDFGSGIKLQTDNFQVTAFGTGKDENFSKDNVQECNADNSTNTIVPIAVGAALAGLVVIVLIAYLIGRRRMKKGYESV